MHVATDAFFASTPVHDHGIMDHSRAATGAVVSWKEKSVFGCFPHANGKPNDRNAWRLYPAGEASNVLFTNNARGHRLVQRSITSFVITLLKINNPSRTTTTRIMPNNASKKHLTWPIQNHGLDYNTRWILVALYLPCNLSSKPHGSWELGLADTDTNTYEPTMPWHFGSLPVPIVGASILHDWQIQVFQLHRSIGMVCWHCWTLMQCPDLCDLRGHDAFQVIPGSSI